MKKIKFTIDFLIGHRKQNFLFLLTLFFLLSCNKEIKKWSFRPNEITGKDAFISHGNPKTSFSGSDKLHMLSLSVNDSIPNDQRFLIRFGFRTIPDKTVVDSAFIYLYALEPGHFGKNNSFMSYEINELWVSRDVNWENQPALREKSKKTYMAPQEKYQNYKIDVTDYVNKVLIGEIKNYGHLFMLEDEMKSYKGVRFHSSNSKKEELRPKLEVFYRE
ncbi:DNRLRE domain-containing protein [Winogradskyella jejuensis]|uniref:Carbohydrate-binding module family 96 domain-containing protein n=1 Tax=Winogradskyella jejuensis TaxID=1089305 RepID=A0A1M5MUI1_9FLAO|nr:DNRLRE domain-containing protein [Winogradskyella jejuensis]SHG80817.1 hypothetical protein SAMN05444148_0997 [Winogradskyella jejuensis]